MEILRSYKWPNHTKLNIQIFMEGSEFSGLVFEQLELQVLLFVFLDIWSHREI